MALSTSKKDALEYVADVFEATDLGAPFKIMLHNSVVVEEDPGTGEMLSYTIPDVAQLLLVALLSRILIPRKLSGAEIKFARKVLGIKQADLAEKLDFSPEHLSRCENDVTPLSPQGDKLFRIFALKEAIALPDMPKSDAKKKLDEGINSVFEGMRVKPAYAVEREIVLDFSRGPCDSAECGDDDARSSDWLERPTGACAA